VRRILGTIWRSPQSIIEDAGTWIPTLLLVLGIGAWLDEKFTGLSWERPLVYAIGMFSLILGVWALVQIARVSGGRISFLLLSFIWQKVMLSGTFFAVFALAANQMIIWFPAMPEAFLFPLLVSTIAATAIVNVALFLGRPRIAKDGTVHRGFIYKQVDPVPFRPLYHAWKNGRGR
jgi:hypothetical protein